MFSVRLKELRIKHNLSQKELAGILKVSTGTVGNWEVGSREPSFEITVKLANLFNVSLDYLLGRNTNSSLTLDEDKLIEAYRIIGKNSGTEGQQALMSVAEVLAKNKKR